MPRLVPAEPASGWTYADYVRVGRELASAAWRLGDLAAGVTTRYGEGRLGKYADDIGVEYTTLARLRTVAVAYPQNARRLACSWSVHQALAAQEDRVELIASRDDWTVAQARELVRSRNPKPEPKQRDADQQHADNVRDYERRKQARRRRSREMVTAIALVEEAIADLADTADPDASELGLRLDWLAQHREQLGEDLISRLRQAVTDARDRLSAWNDRLTTGGD